MNKDNHSIKVEIFGQEYFIRSSQNVDANYIQGVAAYVDKKMREIEKKIKEESQEPSALSTYKIAILSALNVADELFQSRKDKQESYEKHNQEVSGRAEQLIRLIDEVLEAKKS